MTRIITVTSGKGGVGKTNISVNLAFCLAAQGFRTCLFDADLGLANINILLGLNPEYDLEDLISNKKSIEDILIKDCHGIDIIPGSSGVPKMADLEPDQLAHLIESLSRLDGYDFLLFDTSAGVSKNVISFCMASFEVILVVTPEPTSLTDGYSLLKVLSLNGFNKSVMVTVNLCKNVQVAGKIFTKLKETVEKYLTINILPIGTVVYDPHVVEAVRKQKAFISLYPNSNASKCIKNIARHLTRKKSAEDKTDGLETFWTRFMKLLKEPLNMSGIKTRKEHESSGFEEQKNREKRSQESAEKKVHASETVDILPPTEQAGIHGIIEKDHLAQEIHLLLSKLVENTSSISQELGAIRKAIEITGISR